MREGIDSFSTLKALARYWSKVHARKGDWASLHISRICKEFIAARRRTKPVYGWSTEIVSGLPSRDPKRLPK